MSARGDDISRDESNFNLLTVYFSLLLALDDENVNFKVSLS
jgi:hypothetical protein